MPTSSPSSAFSNPRLNYATVAPQVLNAMLALSQSPLDPGLDAALLDLVRLRASDLNGCAFCIAMHVRDAKKRGETDDRLHLLSAWHEVSVYTARERAALLWTDHLTRLSELGVPQSVFDEVRSHFSETELASLSLAIATINGWNRLNVGFRTPSEFVEHLPA